MKNRYPIKDIQFHEERLRDSETDLTPREEAIAVVWHSTAIAYLVVGAQAGLPGPAFVADGRVHLAEDYLIPETDSHGLVNFIPVAKQETPALAG